MINFIHDEHLRKPSSEGIHPGFETQDRRLPKSKTWVSWPHKKGLMYYKKFKDKRLFLFSWTLYKYDTNPD